jgi:Flp pilus assembly protein TadG
MTKSGENLRASLYSFRSAEGGNTLIIFALAAVPLIGFAGAAIDYSRAHSDKAAMQAAADATALMLAKTASSLTPDQLVVQATKYFKSIFTRNEVTGVQVEATYIPAGSQQIVVNASGKVPTSFMNVIGQPSLNITATSTVTWGNSRLRVALVLDNTGSMALSGKMTALKTATKNLLDQLNAAAASMETCTSRLFRSTRMSMLGQPITVRAGSIGPIGTRRTGQTPSYKAAAQAQAKTARRTKSAPTQRPG